MPISTKISSHRYFNLVAAHTGVSGADFQEFISNHLGSGRDNRDDRILMRFVSKNQVPKYLEIEGECLDEVTHVFVVYKELI